MTDAPEGDAELTANLRSLIAQEGVSINEVAKRIGVPYRTLQNQLLGNARMPAAIYLKAMKALGFEVFGARRSIDEEALATALDYSLGDFLPVVQSTGPGSMAIGPVPYRDERDPDARKQDARRLAFFVAFNYYSAVEARRQASTAETNLKEPS